LPASFPAQIVYHVVTESGFITSPFQQVALWALHPSLCSYSVRTVCLPRTAPNTNTKWRRKPKMV